MAETQTPLDIPYKAPVLAEIIDKTHVNARVTPNDDSKYAYSLAVPALWGYSKELGPIIEAPFTPQGLGVFAGSVEQGAPTMAVTVTPISFEIPIDAWVRHSLARSGYKVVAAQFFPGPHGIFFDATATRVSGDREDVVRTTARVDGSNLFSVNTLCARKHWDAAKEIFWVAHVTFELLGATKLHRTEPWKTIEGKGPDFLTAYPFSWFGEVVEEPWPDVSAVNIRLTDAAQTKLLAYVQVKAERRPRPPSLQQLQAEALPKLQQAGFTPSGPSRPLTEEDDPRGPSIDGWLGGSTGFGRLGEGEVVARLGFVQRADVSFTLLAISPRLEDDTLASLRARRAFEIARVSLELPKNPPDHV